MTRSCPSINLMDELFISSSDHLPLLARRVETDWQRLTRPELAAGTGLDMRDTPMDMLTWEPLVSPVLWSDSIWPRK